MVLTVFLSGTIGMYLVLNLFFTDVYETTTRLLVKVGRENMETPATVNNGQLFSQGVRIADINSEVQILSSRELVDRVVDRLGPDTFKRVLPVPASWPGYPKYYFKRIARAGKEGYRDFLIALGLDKRLTERESAIVAVADGVKVEPVRDSDILLLRVRMPNQKLCVDVSNILLDEYMRRRAAARQSPASMKFFEGRLAEARARLAELQRNRFGIRSRWNLSAPEEQRSLYLKELSAIETELTQNNAEMQRLNRQRELMTERVQDLPVLAQKEQTESRNPSLHTLKERITALGVERSKAASKYQPTSEVLQKMDAEIADLQAVLGKEQATVLNSVVSESNPVRRQFDASIEQETVQAAGLEKRNSYLREPAAELSKRVHGIDRGLDLAESTDREYRRAEQDYLTYAKRYEDARLSEELDALRVANVSMVGSPETPLKPVYPKRLFLMEIAMPLSLLLGIALCALLETTEDRVFDERSLLAVDGMTYLGTVDLGAIAGSENIVDTRNTGRRKTFSEV